MHKLVHLILCNILLDNSANLCYNISTVKELIQMKFVPIEKQQKKAQRAYNAQKRGNPIPPSRRGKTPYEYKMMKLKLKGVE